MTTDADEEGRQAYEETIERRRPARRVTIANIELGLSMIFRLFVVGIMLGFGVALGWSIASRLGATWR